MKLEIPSREPGVPSTHSRLITIAVSLILAGLTPMPGRTQTIEQNKEQTITGLPDITSKEACLEYYNKTLRVQLSQDFHKLVESKKWNYDTTEEAFLEDIKKALGELPAFKTLNELMTKGLIKFRPIYIKNEQFITFAIDVRVPGMPAESNGSYMFDSMKNPKMPGGL